MKGYVYILSNPSMPGLVKVGRTTRSVEDRAEELYQTGVPTPFVVEHSVLSPDCVALEAHAHACLEEYRVGKSREFFRCDKLVVREFLECALMDQLEEYVYEYVDTHCLVEQPFALNPEAVKGLCAKAGVEPLYFASVVRFLDADAVAAAYSKADAHQRMMRAISGNPAAAV